MHTKDCTFDMRESLIFCEICWKLILTVMFLFVYLFQTQHTDRKTLILIFLKVHFNRWLVTHTCHPQIPSHFLVQEILLIPSMVENCYRAVLLDLAVFLECFHAVLVLQIREICIMITYSLHEDLEMFQWSDERVYLHLFRSSASRLRARLYTSLANITMNCINLLSHEICMLANLL